MMRVKQRSHRSMQLRLHQCLIHYLIIKSNQFNLHYRAFITRHITLLLKIIFSQGKESFPVILFN